MATTTAAQKFITDPVTFMQSNLLLVDVPGRVNVRGVFYFRITLSTKHACKTATGKGIPVYEARLADYTAQSDQTVQAYWLPYAPGNTYSLILGNEADFVFTPTMNGCTFAVSGSNAPRAMATHLNYQKHTDDGSMKIDQAKIDDRVDAIYGTTNTAVIRKADYISDGGGQELTTFGWRSPATDNWKFYTQQRYMKNFRSLKHMPTQCCEYEFQIFKELT